MLRNLSGTCRECVFQVFSCVYFKFVSSKFNSLQTHEKNFTWIGILRFQFNAFCTNTGYQQYPVCRSKRSGRKPKRRQLGECNSAFVRCSEMGTTKSKRNDLVCFKPTEDLGGTRNLQTFVQRSRWAIHTKRQQEQRLCIG